MQKGIHSVLLSKQEGRQSKNTHVSAHLCKKKYRNDIAEASDAGSLRVCGGNRVERGTCGEARMNWGWRGTDLSIPL